jgi:hypothetical protein
VLSTSWLILLSSAARTRRDWDSAALSARRAGVGAASRAAHQHGQLLADGQAKAGAAELPGDRGVGLVEAPEQPLEHVRRHADAGVRNLQRHNRAVIGAADPDLAAVGKFQCVGNQVVEHLANACRVAAVGAAGRLDIQLKGDALAVGGLGKGGASAQRDIGQVEIDGLDLDLAGFDLGKVE